MSLPKLAAFGPVMISLTVAGGLLAGCAQVEQITHSGPTPLSIDPADPCRSQREAFNNSPYFMRDTIVTSAVMGAAAGAAGGAMTSAATGGNIGTGALVGGGIGLIGGAAAGYYSALQQQYSDQRQLSSRVNRDLAAQGSAIDHTTASFARLRSCRFAQAAHIKSLARRGYLDRSSAISQLNYERNLFQQEIALAREYGVNMGKQGDQFAYASQHVTTNSTRIRLAATETIPEKREGFDNTVDQADNSSKAAFDLDAPSKTSMLMLGLADA